MKFSNIFIGIVCIVLAVIFLLDAIGIIPATPFIGDVSVWQIIAGVLLLGALVACLIKRHIILVVWVAATLFAIFEKNIAFLCGHPDGELINNRVLIGIAVLLSIGLKLLLPRKSRRYIGSCDADETNMGSNNVYIDSASFQQRHHENNMGKTDIYFDNPALYPGNGVLHIENNMGHLQVHVPVAWCVDVNIENHMGHIRNTAVNNPGGPLLRIVGENNMGKIDIQRM